MDDNENLTPAEETQLDNGDTATGEEEHRYAEFEDLRDRMDNVEGMLNKIFNKLDAIAAIKVDNGATISDDGSDAGDTGMGTLDQMAEIAGMNLDDMDWSVK